MTLCHHFCSSFRDGTTYTQRIGGETFVYCEITEMCMVLVINGFFQVGWAMY